eukprot:3699-Amphidinium_carterae.3
MDTRGERASVACPRCARRATDTLCSHHQNKDMSFANHKPSMHKASHVRRGPQKWGGILKLAAGSCGEQHTVAHDASMLSSRTSGLN